MQPIHTDPAPPNWAETCGICGATIVGRTCGDVTQAKTRNGWGHGRCRQHKATT